MKCFALPEEQPLKFDYVQGELTGESCNDNTNINNDNKSYMSDEQSKPFSTPL